MINLTAIDSAFKPETIANQVTQAEYRRWQGAFYSNRSLMWESSKGRIFKDAIQDKVIVAIRPRAKKADGTYTPAEFDEDDIKELYADAWKEFSEQYDDAFVSATIEEIGQYSESHFGINLEKLLELNAQRSAEFYNR